MGPDSFQAGAMDLAGREYRSLRAAVPARLLNQLVNPETKQNRYTKALLTDTLFHQHCSRSKGGELFVLAIDTALFTCLAWLFTSTFPAQCQ